jgi:hypothetical protein
MMLTPSRSFCVLYPCTDLSQRAGRGALRVRGLVCEPPNVTLRRDPIGDETCEPSGPCAPSGGCATSENAESSGMVADPAPLSGGSMLCPAGCARMLVSTDEGCFRTTVVHGFLAVGRRLRFGMRRLLGLRVRHAALA